MKNGMIGPHGMNDILYTAEYFALCRTKPIMHIITLIHQHLSRDDKWTNSDGTTPISHDNMTAIVCLEKLIGGRILFRPEHAYWHPRDFVFYAWNSNSRFWRIFGGSLLWITSLCMIWSVLVDRYKNIDGKMVLATDGKLLTWLRLECTHMPITKWICDKIVKKRSGWKHYFQVYFGEDHINSRLAAGREQ
jgi:hypothetical protein